MLSVFKISLLCSNSSVLFLFGHYPIRVYFPRPMVLLVSHLRSNWCFDCEKGFNLSACFFLRSILRRSWFKFYVLCVFSSVLDGTAFVTTGNFSTNIVSLLLILVPVRFSIDFCPRKVRIHSAPSLLVELGSDVAARGEPRFTPSCCKATMLHAASLDGAVC